MLKSVWIESWNLHLTDAVFFGVMCDIPVLYGNDKF